MGNLPVGSRGLYKGKKRSVGMNELRHPGSTQMTRTVRRIVVANTG